MTSEKSKNTIISKNAWQLKSFGALVSSEYRGPRAGFGEAEVLKAILDIGKIGNVGRGRLAKQLDLGSGEARTLIRRLKNANLIRIESNGCSLTKMGEKKYEEIVKSLPWSSEVPGPLLGIGNKCHAVILRNTKTKLRKGIEQRDAAIKTGAIGAITVIYRSGRFYFPLEKVDCESRGPSEPWTFIRSAPIKNGDIVIISGAEDSLVAEYGTLSAALTLL